MDTVNFEPTVPSPLTKEQKLKLFAFTDGADGYPPHLNLAGNRPAAEMEASAVQKSTLQFSDIFNKMRLLQLSPLLPALIPQNFIKREIAKGLTAYANFKLGSMGTPDAGTKLEDVENYNRQMRSQTSKNDIFNLPNVGDLDDWYTDARFAQQHFTGANPATIEQASREWIKHFGDASKDPADKEAQDTIKALASTSKDSLYVQDYSYFREAAGIDKSAIIRSKYNETVKENGKTVNRDGYRYGVASVCLFYLNNAGTLVPLAIVIDWRGSADRSVTIYNRELFKRDALSSTFDVDRSTGGKKPDMLQEADDWAWRYGMLPHRCILVSTSDD